MTERKPYDSMRSQNCDVAAYVADMLSSLEPMAKAAGRDRLAYFLGMAFAEAQMIVRTTVENNSQMQPPVDLAAIRAGLIDGPKTRDPDEIVADTIRLLIELLTVRDAQIAALEELLAQA